MGKVTDDAAVRLKLRQLASDIRQIRETVQELNERAKEIGKWLAELGTVAKAVEEAKGTTGIQKPEGD